MAARRRKFKPKAIKRNRGPVVWRTDPNKRLLADASVIFAKDPVTQLPGFYKKFHADLTAARKGDASKPKMAARRLATAAKWRPLVDALQHVDLSTDRNFNAERRASIKAQMLLSGVKPFTTIKTAEKTVDSFIRWLRRR